MRLTEARLRILEQTERSMIDCSAGQLGSNDTCCGRMVMDGLLFEPILPPNYTRRYRITDLGRQALANQTGGRDG